MDEDKFDNLNQLLDSLGERLTTDLGGDSNGIFLYVEVGDRWISTSIFREEGEVVRYLRHDPELTDILWDLWRAENPDKKMRWAVMEYAIRKGKFEAEFTYPDEVDVESFDVDRRELPLKRRFGDKPIIYPPRPQQ